MPARKALGLIALSVPLGAPLACFAQPAGRTLRLAILDDASESARAERWQAFRARLRELGYIEGKNLVIEARYARGANERLPALAAELVALKPDVIVTAATPPAKAAVQATRNIPIVFTGVADPVATGLVASFGRPGGNATGLSIITPELGTKWIELLREPVPGAKRVAYLTDTGSEGGMLVFKRMQEQARKLDVAVEVFGGQHPKELERSFEAIARERFPGLIVGATARLEPIIGGKSCSSQRSTSSRPSTGSASMPMPEDCFRTARSSGACTSGPQITFTGSRKGPNPRSCRLSVPRRFGWCLT